MQQAGAIAAFLIELEHARQGARVFGGVQRQVPEMLGMARQDWIAELGATLEREPEDQVHALGCTQLVQRLHQTLHRAITMQCSAVGSGDEHGCDLWIVADLGFQHLEVQPLGLQAALDRQLHVGKQRAAIGGGAAPLEEARQG
ncbi:hypothetical protein D9M71_709290 [compost metagenome]